MYVLISHLMMSKISHWSVKGSVAYIDVYAILIIKKKKKYWKLEKGREMHINLYLVWMRKLMS